MPTGPTEIRKPDGLFGPAGFFTWLNGIKRYAGYLISDIFLVAMKLPARRR